MWRLIDKKISLSTREEVFFLSFFLFHTHTHQHTQKSANNARIPTFGYLRKQRKKEEQQQWSRHHLVIFEFVAWNDNILYNFVLFCFCAVAVIQWTDNALLQSHAQ